MKKRWFAVPLIAGAVAIGVLTVGAISIGTASAQEAETQQMSIKDTFVAKVADILGLGEDEVQSAFDQARSEIHDEMLEARLDRLVEAGTITEEDKADILAWLADKPEVLDDLGMMGKGGHGFGIGGPAIGIGGNIEDRLARAVENGVLTQDQADDILAWYEARPAVVDELPGILNEGNGSRGKGRMHGRFIGPNGGEFEFRGQFRGRFQPPTDNGTGESVPQIAPSDAISF
jgi:hypothetical protein